MKLNELQIKIFADGANIDTMRAAYTAGLVSGFTTNPTLMKKDGVKNYCEFAKAALSVIKTMPISFEVFSNDFNNMELEALKISSWAPNAYVKIPIMNTFGDSSIPLISKLSAKGIKLNITAIMTLAQVEAAANALSDAPSVISVFAGRIADTGRDPIPTMSAALRSISNTPNIELLWASTREFFNIFQAASIGCHIITVSDSILKKAEMIDINLDKLSLDTVAMFYRDAVSSNFKIV
jgi:transaldolase